MKLFLKHLHERCRGFCSGGKHPPYRTEVTALHRLFVYHGHGIIAGRDAYKQGCLFSLYGVQDTFGTEMRQDCYGCSRLYGHENDQPESQKIIKREQT